MKLYRNFKHILLFATMTLCFSCQQENCYSCDDFVESWVQLRIDQVPYMSWEEVISHDASKQRGLYNAFTPQKRKEIWLEKFNFIKQLGWSESELRHLEIMEAFLREIDYSGGMEEEDADFIFDWFKEGKKEFGWTKSFMVSSFMRLGKPAKTKEEYMKLYANGGSGNNTSTNLKSLSTLNTANSETGDTKDCKCRESLLDDHCGDLEKCNSEKDCKLVQLGCGFLWLSACNGLCVSLAN